MDVVVLPDPRRAERLAARLIADELRGNPRLVLGLATGRTMEQVYRELVELHRREALDFAGCRSFNLDEYAGLPATSPNSYRAYMQRHLFDQVNLDPANTHLPDGTAGDLAAECSRYEELIEQCGGIDLQLLGIGLDGHIGFNEPLSSFASRTRVVMLSPETMAQNGPLFDDLGQMPRRALTMGVGTILEANRCLLLATGAEKNRIVTQFVEGPLTAMISASALHLHPHCTVILDEAAGGGLQGLEHYRWIFANEPKWNTYR
ncbi:MAG: glucosamine-6-phosphate deaminase [Kiritimatiellia bacterium]|nr:glucosamine-6-phosphate deaminase [Lentisphaerota bacterium]